MVTRKGDRTLTWGVPMLLFRLSDTVCKMINVTAMWFIQGILVDGFQSPTKCLPSPLRPPLHSFYSHWRPLNHWPICCYEQYKVVIWPVQWREGSGGVGISDSSKKIGPVFYCLVWCILQTNILFSSYRNHWILTKTYSDPKGECTEI